MGMFYLALVVNTYECPKCSHACTMGNQGYAHRIEMSENEYLRLSMVLSSIHSLNSITFFGGAGGG